MTDVVTPNLGLTEPTFNDDKNTWGYICNTNFDLIDAFAGKPPIKLSSGSGIDSSASIALPTIAAGRRSFQLRMLEVRASAGWQIFARLSFDSAATWASGSSDYAYARTDLSVKSGGTQTFDASAAASAIMLSPALALNGSAQAYSLAIDLDVYEGVGNQSCTLTGRGTYQNDDGSGYLTHSNFSGTSLTLTAVPTNIQIVAMSAGSPVTGLRSNWSLFAFPGA